MVRSIAVSQHWSGCDGTACGVASRAPSCLLRLPQVSKIIELSKHLDCEYQFDPTVAPRSDGDASVLRYRLPAEGVRQFFLSDRALEKTREGRLAIHPGELPDRQLGNCGAGVASLHIESNGDLLACIGLRPAIRKRRPIVRFVRCGTALRPSGTGWRCSGRLTSAWRVICVRSAPSAVLVWPCTRRGRCPARAREHVNWLRSTWSYETLCEPCRTVCSRDINTHSYLS